MTGIVPSVSIVLPVFNGKPYVSEALESILNQDFSNFEVICIDDGSTDGSDELLSSYAGKDERITLLRNQSNLGLIRSLNKGLSKARGKYIARQDADDVSAPSRLRTEFDYLESHPEIGLLGSSYYRVDAQGARTLRHPPVKDTAIRWKLLFGNIWCHASIMFRRDLLERSGVYQDFLHAEDYELWTRMIRHTKVSTIRSPLVKYRVHPTSICSLEGALQVPMVRAISEREIHSVVPEFQPDEILLVQRCFRTNRASVSDLVSGFKPMLRMFDRFQEMPYVNRTTVRRIRNRWIKRVLMRVPKTYLRKILTHVTKR